MKFTLESSTTGRGGAHELPLPTVPTALAASCGGAAASSSSLAVAKDLAVHICTHTICIAAGEDASRQAVEEIN